MYSCLTKHFRSYVLWLLVVSKFWSKSFNLVVVVRQDGESASLMTYTPSVPSRYLHERFVTPYLSEHAFRANRPLMTLVCCLQVSSPSTYTRPDKP